MDLKSTGHQPLAAALCGVLFAASLVIAPPASAQDVTIWSADLDVKTLNTAQDEFGCSERGPFNGQCSNSNVLSDDDFEWHGTTYTIRRIEDDGSDLKLTLNSLLPSNVLKILTLHLDDAGAAITALQLPEAMGGEGDVTYRVFDLPAGLTFDADTRTISGTPAAATDGAVEVTYLAQDSAGASAALTFSITVNPELRLGLGDS